MSKLTVNRSKTKNLTKNELLELNKEELVDRIMQLEAHNLQLKRIISKNIDSTETSLDDNFDTSKNKKKFDFTKCNFRRILLRLGYFGKQYRGLAVQEDSTNTIEHFLFKALQKSQLIPSRDKANYHRCGRTDKGVSASGQVISLIVRSKLSNEELAESYGNLSKEISYCKVLNRLFPDDIRAISWMPIGMSENGEPFSARFDCKQRTYKYWFPKLLLDVEAMRQASGYLVGTHDFRNLCKMDVANGVTSYLRHIHSVEVIPENSESQDNEYSMYYLKIVANAFLWHQIRCIAGVLFLIGSGVEQPSIVQNLLDVDKHPRKPQYNMAIDSPLNLFHCQYDVIKNDDPDELEKLNITADLLNQKTVLGIGNKLKKWWNVDIEDLVMVIKCFREQWTKAAIEASMIKDVINDLENLYSVECKRQLNKESVQTNIKTYSKEEFSIKVFSAYDLIQGVRPKTYVPLLKRPTCETLENRIEHYVKKKRLNEIPMEVSTSEELQV
ncbi:tRNA pseudouridine(38/39) synthase [Arctopsyche grandis]|uniref:tRNA pseudouridine(38/39) synthase n=1 Tax=Arctopsyche grandis TaxID=121162 RepID=UPI00406D730C